MEKSGLKNMLGHGLYSTFCDKENNQFLIRVYMSIFSDKKKNINHNSC